MDKPEVGERIVAAAVACCIIATIFMLLVLLTPTGGWALVLGHATGWWSYPAAAFGASDACWFAGMLGVLATSIVLGW